MSKETVLLQVRLEPKDKEMIETIAKLYGLDTRQFVPLAAKYVAQQQPTLEISPLGKDFAPVLQTA